MSSLVSFIFLLLSFKDVDWSRTKACSIGHFGNIIINLKGRQPQGIVQPGEEFEKLREKICDELRALVLPTGKLAKLKIDFKEDIYHGPYLNDAADIVFNINDYSYDTSFHFEFGSNKIFGEHLYHQTGTHRREGIFAIKGKGIKRANNIGEMDIIDIAPTILHIAGVKIPSDIDGKILRNCFEEDSEIFQRKKQTKEELGLFFGEITPMSLGREFSHIYPYKVAPFLKFAGTILSPLVYISTRISLLIGKIFANKDLKTSYTLELRG